MEAGYFLPTRQHRKVGIQAKALKDFNLPIFIYVVCPVCDPVPSVRAACPTLVNIMMSGYMRRDAKQQGGYLSVLKLGHFQQVSPFSER